MVTSRAGQPPVVLIAVSRERPLVSVLQGMPHEVYHVHTGQLLIDCAPALRPDVIMLASALPDMTGIEACRALNAIPHIGHNIPILILASDLPTPEQRVAALEAGAWDFARYPTELAELSLKVQAYVQAKRNIDVALAESSGERLAIVHDRTMMARRARELGALMARVKGSLACVVFVIESDPTDPRTASLVARWARTSDVVGALRPTEIAVVAPATSEIGAVQLAHRIAAAVQRELGASGLARSTSLNVGYDAITNMGYRPIDPVSLVARASAAARIGKPEPGHLWLRRYDDTIAWKPLGEVDAAAPAPGKGSAT